jgi:hypothetical protein
MVTFLLALLIQSYPRPVPPAQVAQFQRALQGATLGNLPKPLFDGKDHWGETKKTVIGMKWKPAPELQYGQRNHGTWRAYTVKLKEPHTKHLKLAVRNMNTVGNNTLRFDIQVNANVEFDVTQQNWNAGVKLFDGSVRGGANVTLKMTCESTLIIEPTSNFVPNIRYRLRVVRSQASYDDLSFDHVPGLGGTAAKVVGEWTVDAIKQLKPSLERKLIDKLTQKLTKAADTKEIQLSLAGIEKRKSDENRK